MATLRSNVLISTAAMVLVGLIGPGFNTVVLRVFGAEVNGRAAALIAVIMLATLPATAALPTVMMRHVSHALGAGRHEEANIHTRMAFRAALLLTGLAIAAALAYGRWLADPKFNAIDAVLVGLGMFAYTYWRVVRTLLLVIGEAMRGLVAELTSILWMGGVLGLVVITGRSEWALAGFIAAYVGFVPATLAKLKPLVVGSIAAPDVSMRSDFLRFNLYWFLATGASLSVQHLAVLFMNERVEGVLVGEMAMALSLLKVLAFAPRVIELPLVHELSALAAKDDPGAQQQLTNTAFHWMTVFTFALGCGAAILSRPILSYVGAVGSTVVFDAFSLIALAFMLEMMITPATNLMVASAPPAVFVFTGASSLLVALAWWFTPYADDVMGVTVGLALSYLVRAIGLTTYAKVRFGLTLLHLPVRKVFATILGLVLVVAAARDVVHPWIAFVAFELAMLALFFGTIKEVASSLVGRPPRRAAADAASSSS